MYLSLLLPLLVASGPGQPAAATADDPPIQIWINNDGRFLRGDRARVHVRTEDDGYLVVLHADAMHKAAQNVYETLRRDGSQKAVVDTMQTRQQLYDAIGYWDYERKLDELFAKAR